MSTYRALATDTQNDLATLLPRLRNYVLVVGVLGATGWLLVNGLPPAKPAASLPAPQVLVAAAAGPDASNWQGSALERRDPVPMVRKVQAVAYLATAPSNEAPVTAQEPESRNDLERQAATRAAELDGYRRVSIMGRTSDGAWRAKGYRGTAEVLLTVDATGRVASD